jgi:hypothetical protein
MHGYMGMLLADIAATVRLGTQITSAPKGVEKGFFKPEQMQ